VDPFFDHNPASTDSDELERVDLICVSHAAFDDMSDPEAIAPRTGAPVVCGGDVQHCLMARGIPEKRTRATVWGIAGSWGASRCSRWRATTGRR
jgi:L-ascorbate metabolism protein UlaG (beta-lactamase superfamily)